MESLPPGSGSTTRTTRSTVTDTGNNENASTVTRDGKNIKQSDPQQTYTPSEEKDTQSSLPKKKLSARRPRPADDSMSLPSSRASTPDTSSTDSGLGDSMRSQAHSVEPEPSQDSHSLNNSPPRSQAENIPAYPKPQAHKVKPTDKMHQATQKADFVDELTHKFTAFFAAQKGNNIRKYQKSLQAAAKTPETALTTIIEQQLEKHLTSQSDRSELKSRLSKLGQRCQEHRSKQDYKADNKGKNEILLQVANLGREYTERLNKQDNAGKTKQEKEKAAQYFSSLVNTFGRDDRLTHFSKNLHTAAKQPESTLTNVLEEQLELQITNSDNIVDLKRKLSTLSQCCQNHRLNKDHKDSNKNRSDILLQVARLGRDFTEALTQQDSDGKTKKEKEKIAHYFSNMINTLARES